MTGAVSIDGGRPLQHYITRLLYAVVLVMPLHPWLGMHWSLLLFCSAFGIPCVTDHCQNPCIVASVVRVGLYGVEFIISPRISSADVDNGQLAL